VDAQAIALGHQYIVYGPDLRIPQVAVGFMTRRFTLAKRLRYSGDYARDGGSRKDPAHGQRVYVQSSGQTAEDCHRKILETGYNAEIKALEPRLTIRPEAFQAVLDDVAQIDPRAKKVKPDDIIDR
jgi:hypothetical protein